jgi:hypothetical protein
MKICIMGVGIGAAASLKTNALGMQKTIRTPRLLTGASTYRFVSCL